MFRFLDNLVKIRIEKRSGLSKWGDNVKDFLKTKLGKGKGNKFIVY